MSRNVEYSSIRVTAEKTDKNLRQYSSGGVIFPYLRKQRVVRDVMIECARDVYRRDHSPQN